MARIVRYQCRTDLQRSIGHARHDREARICAEHSGHYFFPSKAGCHLNPTLPLTLGLAALLGGALLAVALRSNRASAAAALASQTLAMLLVLGGIAPLLQGGGPIEATWAAPRPIETVTCRIDALGTFFLAWSLPMILLGTCYSVGYLKPYFDAGRHGGSHYALLNVTAASLVIVYTVQNALVFLLGWEFAAVAPWLLVIWDYPNQRIRFAGFNYLVSTHVGLFVLVAAFMRLHSQTSSMDFADFGRFLSRPSDIRGSIFLLLGVSFALKSAFFPFHTWVPRAESVAPAHVAALMSGVIHKAGLFGFLRFTLLMGKPEEWMGWTVIGFGALSAFFGALYTCPQRDLKRLLGYSSIENVGIAAMGFGVGYLGWTWGIPSLVVAGFAGGLLHVLNHALFKCLLFYSAGSVYRATHSVDLERLGGLARRLPWTAGLFLLGGLAISGLPPLNGFTSELLIYSGLLGGQSPHAAGRVALLLAAAVLAFVGAISAFSMTRAFGIAFLGNARDPKLHVTPDEPTTMVAPMILHGLGVIAIGVAPGLGLALISPVLALIPAAGDVGAANAVLGPVSSLNRIFAGLLLAVGLVTWYRGRAARRSVTWGCGYTSGSTRMQYTGGSFAEQFARIFRALLPSLRRERLPDALFPPHESHLATHHYDAVERRMFEVLGHGEDAVTRAAERIPESPHVAFAAGLAAVAVMGFLVATGVGR